MEKPNKDKLDLWIRELGFLQGFILGSKLRSENLNDIILFFMDLRYGSNFRQKTSKGN